MRFYGGQPGLWLDEVPMRQVRTFARMLPVLEAEEAMRDVEVAAVGGGTLKPDVAKAIIRRWERAANGGRALKARPFQPGAIPGISVRKVEKKAVTTT